MSAVKMIFSQTLDGLKKGVWLTVLICLSLAVGLFLVAGTVNYYAASSDKSSAF